MDVNKLLWQVKNGEIDIKEAEKILKKLPYEDLGFAKLDYHRKLRQGVAEVVYCEGKELEHLGAIFKALSAEEGRVLGTRAGEEQYKYVKQLVPEVSYDKVSRTLILEREKIALKGKVAICAAGTADIPVAEEAVKTAEFLGSNVKRIYDIGIAGIHRIFANLDDINSANCIIAVAGMEGALPGILAGLVDKPVIAVPTSIGYGSNFEGLSALLTMMNTCANGVSVVNIDNGYGAAYIANQINMLAIRP